MTFFGWGGRKEFGIHLCSWVHLAKPKHLGGWGLKNLFLFNRGISNKFTVESLDGGWDMASSDQR
jgi:hypothetical protein